MNKENLKLFKGGYIPVVGQIVYYNSNNDWKYAYAIEDIRHTTPRDIRVCNQNGDITIISIDKLYESKIKFEKISYDELVDFIASNLNFVTSGYIDYYSCFILQDASKLYAKRGNVINNRMINNGNTIEQYIQQAKENNFWDH